MKGGKAPRKITSFRGAGQQRTAREVEEERKRKQAQKITNALRKRR